MCMWHSKASAFGDSLQSPQLVRQERVGFVCLGHVCVAGGLAGGCHVKQTCTTHTRSRHAPHMKHTCHHTCVLSTRHVTTHVCCQVDMSRLFASCLSCVAGVMCSRSRHARDLVQFVRRYTSRLFVESLFVVSFVCPLHLRGGHQSPVPLTSFYLHPLCFYPVCFCPLGACLSHHDRCHVVRAEDMKFNCLFRKWPPQATLLTTSLVPLPSCSFASSCLLSCPLFDCQSLASCRSLATRLVVPSLSLLHPPPPQTHSLSLLLSFSPFLFLSLFLSLFLALSRTISLAHSLSRSLSRARYLSRALSLVRTLSLFFSVSLAACAPPCPFPPPPCCVVHTPKKCQGVAYKVCVKVTWKGLGWSRRELVSRDSAVDRTCVKAHTLCCTTHTLLHYTPDVSRHTATKQATTKQEGCRR